MKFAEIIYEKENKHPLRELYSSLFNPFIEEETEIFGADGYIIKVNVSKQGKEQNRQRALNKIEKFLSQNGVVSTVNEGFRGLYAANGNIVRGLLAGNVVREAKEVVIIGGEEELTKLLLMVVCPRASQVSLLSNKANIYYDYVQYFFRECGISVQIISSLQHENIKNADVIINCSSNKISIFHLLKKDCIYYDVLGENHCAYRGDKIRCISSVDIKFNGKSIKEEVVEAALYAYDMDFKKIVDGSAENAEKLAAYVDKQLKVVYNL